MKKINEKSTFTLALGFFDDDNNPVIPTNLKYEIIDDKTSGVVLNSVTITPTVSTEEIIIPSVANKIINDTNRSEPKTIVIEWDYGDSGHGTENINYQVENLVGITD